jgi:hypothetical protein
VSQETTNRSFDELARGLASGEFSRRKALRLMGGLLVGSALGSIPGVAWADDDRCSEGQTRCGERCVNLQRNERHCGSCSNRCRSTQTCCNGRCVNLQRNERHCGSCSNRCEEGQECVEGVCGQACLSNSLSCTDGSQCCSNNCDSGFCLPPTGLTFLTCVCSDSTSFQRCTSLECSDPLFEVCSPLCSSHGGVSSTVCGCDAPPCCSG